MKGHTMKFGQTIRAIESDIQSNIAVIKRLDKDSDRRFHLRQSIKNLKEELEVTHFQWAATVCKAHIQEVFDMIKAMTNGFLGIKFPQREGNWINEAVTGVSFAIELHRKQVFRPHFGEPVEQVTVRREIRNYLDKKGRVVGGGVFNIAEVRNVRPVIDFSPEKMPSGIVVTTSGYWDGHNWQQDARFSFWRAKTSDATVHLPIKEEFREWMEAYE